MASLVISVNVTRFARRRVGAEIVGHVPGDGLALAVEVGREHEVVGPLEGPLQLLDVPLRVLGTTYSGSKSWSGSTPSLALGEVPDVPYEARTV